jgi:cytidylate kinase
MPRDEKPKKPIKERDMVICICGMAGSGKSTAAKKIAAKYNLKYFSGGDALKALAIEEGYKSLKRGWWETDEGRRFLKERAESPIFDETVDKKLLEMANRGKVVLDSWTMPWLLKKGFKIWLETSPEKRAERIAIRDRITVKKAFEALRSKEERTKVIYRKLYGFSLGEDFEPFHLILDTNNLKAEEVFQILCTVIDNIVVDPKNIRSFW